MERMGDNREVRRRPDGIRPTKATSGTRPASAIQSDLKEPPPVGPRTVAADVTIGWKKRSRASWAGVDARIRLQRRVISPDPQRPGFDP